MVEFSNPATYELWMGRWSRLLAPALVTFANLPRGARLLDVGSGTGALSMALLEGVADSTVVGIEPAETYVSYCRDKISDSCLRFEVGDALNIPFNDDSFDATLSLLILQELSDAPLALREKRRVIPAVIKNDRWAFKRHAAFRRISGDARSRLPTVIMSQS